MPACVPWISQAVVPGLSFSSVTQRACSPSGPGKVAGPDAVVPMWPMVPAVPGAGLDGVACGAWCEQPATAAASSSAVARTSLFGDT